MTYRTDSQSALLPRGAGRQPGPVTLALRAMRTADPDQAADDAIEALRKGLDRHLSGTHRQRLRALCKRVADRIERDLALLDVLAGDVDLEDADAEMTADEWAEAGAHRFNRGVAA